MIGQRQLHPTRTGGGSLCWDWWGMDLFAWDLWEQACCPVIGGRMVPGRAMALINPALTRAPHFPAPQGVPAASPRPPQLHGRRGRACCPAPPAPPTACTARPAAASCCCSATRRAQGCSSPGTCHRPVTGLSPACHLPCPLTTRVTPSHVSLLPVPRFGPPLVLREERGVSWEQLQQNILAQLRGVLRGEVRPQVSPGNNPGPSKPADFGGCCCPVPPSLACPGGAAGQGILSPGDPTVPSPLTGLGSPFPDPPGPLHLPVP